MQVPPQCAQTLCRPRNQNRNRDFVTHQKRVKECRKMNGIIYLVGLVVVVLAILSFFGLR